MLRSIDLQDCDTPESFPDMLERAADRFREAPAELSAAWQDKSAGKIWGDFANILERAAKSARRAIDRRK